MSTIHRNKQRETRGVPECTRKEQAVRVACQAQRTLFIPVSNLTILYSRKHQKIVQACLPVELITFIISLMEQEQNAIQETHNHLPTTPAKTAGLSKLRYVLALPLDGRWQMADGRDRWQRESRKNRPLFDPALQTLGQEEALLAAASALLLCACAKKTTTRLWTR